MTARAQAFVLFLFGAALLRLGSGTTLLRYVLPRARVWVLLAGAVMVLLAGWASTAASGPHKSSRIGWLAVAPVVAVVVIGAPPLGAFTARHAATTLAARRTADFGPLPRGDPVAIKVSDFFLRSIWNGGRTLHGRTVRMTGFVSSGAADGFVMARLVITCCAADAAPILVRVRSGAGAPAVDRWVEVTGRYAGQDPGDRDLPVLAATAVQPVRAPDEPYE